MGSPSVLAKHRRNPIAGRVGMAALVLATFALGGCGDIFSPDRGTIDDDTFVDVYVDLRAAALRSPGQEIPPEERDRILQEHGVEEDELVGFVETHGADIHRMRDIWERVSDRLDEMREVETDPPEEGEVPPEPPNG